MHQVGVYSVNRRKSITYKKFSEHLGNNQFLSCFFRFQPRQSEPDYVHIDPIHYVMSCRSTVGRKGGKQIVRAGNCKVDGKFHYGPLIHELMHVAGI